LPILAGLCLAIWATVSFVRVVRIRRRIERVLKDRFAK
jgi:hypothetical protein